MMPSPVEQIKGRLDVVEIIREYIKLQKAGANFRALCPFHNEKTPSFYVTPERQIWHCFGCQKGGDLISFVQEMDGLDFPETLKLLAQKAGVEIRPSRFNARNKDQKQKLFAINELAAKFFEKQLHESNRGAAVRAYMQKRGMEQETMRTFSLGYAPNAWNTLIAFLKNAGYEESDIEKTGLVIKSRTPGRGFYDRFRDRIIFPIADSAGHIVGFTGRIFEAPPHSKGISVDTAHKTTESAAKYVNTPQTLLYDKGRTLYGLDRAKIPIRQKKQVLIVEGNVDVILSHQAGVANTVASSGTALTEHQARILKRYTDNFTFCFDDDAAGFNATQRGIKTALALGCNVRILPLPEKYKDPADYIAIHGKKWRSYAVQKPQNMMDFLFQKAHVDRDPGHIEQKKDISAFLLPFIKMLTNRVEQSHWIGELAASINTKEEALEEEMRKITTAMPQLSKTAKKLEKTAHSLLDDAILSLVLRKPDLVKKLENMEQLLLNKEYQMFLKKMKGLGNFDATVKNLARESRLKYEILHLKAQKLWADAQDEEIDQQFERIIKKIKKTKLLESLNTLEGKIKKAEQNAPHTVNDLLKEVKKITTQLKALS